MAMDLDNRWPSWPKESYSSLQSAIDEDFIMDFSDTLFSSLTSSQPFDFPNPREIGNCYLLCFFLNILLHYAT